MKNILMMLKEWRKEVVIQYENKLNARFDFMGKVNTVCVSGVLPKGWVSIGNLPVPDVDIGA